VKWAKASEFKADCVRVSQDVGDSDPILVVKSGKVRGVFSRAKPKTRAYFGMDKGKIRIVGDIVSPMYDAWEWTPGRDARRK
jgi:hypothetical protein